ncbi:acyl-CoA ligase (AMP-forming), exosortase A system-associated [Actinoplanes sp. NBC_00393]|uniref:acyl-CoA ligase (AMP-forming), exosortase A system-associated n=1 Tax=Actinoplanes sp. NBC_00393 TaxID=2975953 RepID=UPI002E23FD33
MPTQLHHLLAGSAHRHGDRPALTVKDITVSYAELWGRVRGAAQGLRSLGIARGERIAVYADKRIETVTAIFATSAAGAVVVPANPLLRAEQVGHILTDCTVTALVTTPERLTLLTAELERCKSIRHVVVLGTPRAVPSDAHYTVVTWDDLTGEAELADGIDADLAAIFYTSGSTGRPKGVVLSHRNLIAGAESVSGYLGNTADDAIAAALPLSFDAGFSQLTTGFSVGAHVVLINYLGAADVVAACSRHGVTGLTCVPPLWIQLAEHDWPPQAAGRLRYFANTGGRMPRPVLDRLRQLFPQARPFLMYGLTEAFRSTYLDPAQVDRRPDSIGKAIPNVELMVVRPDGTECAAGEPGELVHRGALVAQGYWNAPEATAARFRPAPGRDAALCLSEIAVWSGDIVVRDEDGFLYFVGRNDEMIKTSGYRVSPTEIEEAVYDTGLIRDVVALGVDDDRLGQHVALVVSPRPGAEVDTAGLVKQLRRRLPLYMVPQTVLVRDELPRSPNGKFDRTTLRREVTA